MIKPKQLIPLCGLILLASLLLNATPQVQAQPSTFISISLSGTISSSTTGVSWLHTSGLYIYDTAGKRVNLYAVNVAYGGGDGISLEDIQKIKTLGFNTFRLHIYWGLMQPYNESSSGIDQSYFTTSKAPLKSGIDQVIQWARQENMYVIMTLLWTDTWTPPSWTFSGLTNYDQQYAALISGIATRENTGLRNCYNFLANRYKDTPNVIFEMMNEPCVLDRSLAGSPYKTFNENLISAIEAAENTSHLKIIELLNIDPAWEEILDTALDVNNTNVVWATHSYYPLNNWDPNMSYWHESSFNWHGQYFPQGWGNGTEYVAYRLIIIADKIHSWNRPWINTEFSKVVTQTNWNLWFNTVLTTETENNITGWTLHCYSNNPDNEYDWNINNPTTQQLIMNVIRQYMIQL